MCPRPRNGLDGVHRRAPAARHVLHDVLDDGAVLHDLLPGEIDVHVVAGTGDARDVEARQVAALAAAPADVRTGQRNGHVSTLILSGSRRTPRR